MPPLDTPLDSPPRAGTAPTGPATPRAEMLAQCESLCRAGSFTLAGAELMVHPSAGLQALLGSAGSGAPLPLAQVPWIPETERRLVAHLWQNATPGTPFDIRHELLAEDGRRLQVVHRGLMLAPDASASAPRGFAILQDVTPLRDAEQRLQQLVHANETTGLPNRAWLLLRLDIAVSASARDGRCFSVLSIDVPRIAELASSMGFGAADALATAMAARLMGLAGRDEVVAQLGSGEFALLIRHPRRDNHDPVRQRAQQVVQALEQPVRLGRMDVFPTCRIGVAVFPEDGDGGAQVLEAAQVARADASASQPVSFHTPASTARALREMSLEAELRQALELGEFALHYQPQVCLTTGEILGVEALLRWQRSGGELVPPDEFLPVAERSGLVAPIGDWAIHEACRQSVVWRQAGHPPVKVAINLSPVQFQVGDVEATLRHALAASGARPEDLCLELTESALLHDEERVSSTMGHLQALGMEIALDDFGTGFSSLSRLRQLPIDLLKIDRSFVNDITRSGESASMIRSIVKLAHGLNIRVLAEGVETEGQLAMLAAAGCDRIQGFLFSRPIPGDALGEMLLQRHQLPLALTRQHARQGTLLLVDDEANIISALKRLFRRDGYRILTANSGMEALELLATTEVDVIVSDQRMPGMAGVDFLRKAKELWPDTIRMTLSGFTDLQSIIDAVNEGAVFKFLVKPWDDERLREHVAQAFAQKEMGNENRRLNQELARAGIEQAGLNRRLASLLAQQREQVDMVAASAGGMRDLLELLPAAVLGLDPDGLLAYVNRSAAETFPEASAHLGLPPSGALADLLNQLRQAPRGGGPEGMVLGSGERYWRAWLRRIEGAELNRGDLVVLMPCCQGSDT